MENLLKQLSSDTGAAVRLAEVLAHAVENSGNSNQEHPEAPGRQSRGKDGAASAICVPPTTTNRKGSVCQSGVLAEPTHEAGGSGSAHLSAHREGPNLACRPVSEGDVLPQVGSDNVHVWRDIGSRKRSASSLLTAPAKRAYGVVHGSDRRVERESSDSDTGSDDESEFEASSYDDQDDVDESDVEDHSPDIQHKPRADFDPSQIDAEEGFVVGPDVASYLKKHLRVKLERDSRKRLVKTCPRPANVLEACTPKCDSFIPRPKKQQHNKSDLDRTLYSIQDKVLDVTGPLCAVYQNAVEAESQGKAIAAGDVITAVQQALVLVGNASEHISSERRFRLLKRSEPSAVPVLQGQLHVTGKHLFGEAFLSKMKSQAKEAKAFRELGSTMAKRRKPASSYSGNSASQYSSKAQDHHRPRSASGSLFQEAPGSRRSPAFRSRGTNRFRGSSRGAYQAKPHRHHHQNPQPQ